jgi:hypothetical protein
MNQAREAHHSARPLHSPKGGQSAAGFAADWPPEGDLTRADAAKRDPVAPAMGGGGNARGIAEGNARGGQGPGAKQAQGVVGGCGAC